MTAARVRKPVRAKATAATGEPQLCGCGVRVDADERLLGVLSLHALVLTRYNTPVSELMVRDIISVPVDADQEAAARILTEHDLIALPVVDHDGRLVGIITADDVADVLEAEVTEDIERLESG